MTCTLKSQKEEKRGLTYGMLKSMYSNITSNNKDNNSTYNGKKESLRVGDIMKYYPYMSNNSCMEIL